MKNNMTALVKTKEKALPVPPNTSDLTDKEQDHLEHLEAKIEANFKSAFEMAAALAEIRAKRLYRQNYSTFEEYCKVRWDYSRSYCERLAAMHEVLVDLKGFEDNEVFPRNELQARMFVPLNKDQRIKLLKTVQEQSTADNNTAAELIKYRKQLFPEPIKKEATSGKSKEAVIDVKASISPMPSVPSVIKLVASAKSVLDGLAEKGRDEDKFAEDLREFLTQADPLVKWQKANLK
jgi:hypothetical protein